MACVAKWEGEEGTRPKNKVTQMIKCQNGDFALATEVGVEFIQVTCKKVKGKNKFSFVSMEASSTVISQITVTSIAEYSPSSFLVISDEDLLLYSRVSDSLICSLTADV